MKVDGGSTVPRRQLGRQLRQLREEAQVTVKDAAEGLEVSPQKIWRLETGRGQERIRAVDVVGLCRLYGAPERVITALVALARETKAGKAWWQSYADVLPDWFEPYAAMEAAASRIRQYEPMLVPGLLQIRAYAEALFRLHDRRISAADLDRRVSARIERQALLVRTFPAAPPLEVMLSEAALRQPIGDVAAMVTQLRAVVAASRTPHISVRVLPLAAGPTPASFAGAFSILDFPPAPGGGEGEPTTIYSETLTGAIYLDAAEEISAYEEVWAALVTTALDEGESREMITSIIGEWGCLT